MEWKCPVCTWNAYSANATTATNVEVGVAEPLSIPLACGHRLCTACLRRVLLTSEPILVAVTRMVCSKADRDKSVACMYCFRQNTMQELLPRVADAVAEHQTPPVVPVTAPAQVETPVAAAPVAAAPVAVAPVLPDIPMVLETRVVPEIPKPVVTEVQPAVDTDAGDAADPLERFLAPDSYFVRVPFFGNATNDSGFATLVRETRSEVTYLQALVPNAATSVPDLPRRLKNRDYSNIIGVLKRWGRDLYRHRDRRDRTHVGLRERRGLDLCLLYVMEIMRVYEKTPKNLLTECHGIIRVVNQYAEYVSPIKDRANVVDICCRMHSILCTTITTASSGSGGSSAEPSAHDLHEFQTVVDLIRQLSAIVHSNAGSHATLISADGYDILVGCVKWFAHGPGLRGVVGTQERDAALAAFANVLKIMNKYCDSDAVVSKLQPANLALVVPSHGGSSDAAAALTELLLSTGVASTTVIDCRSILRYRGVVGYVIIALAKLRNYLSMAMHESGSGKIAREVLWASFSLMISILSRGDRYAWQFVLADDLSGAALIRHIAQALNAHPGARSDLANIATTFSILAMLNMTAAERKVFVDDKFVAEVSQNLSRALQCNDVSGCLLFSLWLRVAQQQQL